MVVAKAEEREKPRVKTVGERKSIAMVMVMGRTEEKEKKRIGIVYHRRIENDDDDEEERENMKQVYVFLYST